MALKSRCVATGPICQMQLQKRLLSGSFLFVCLTCRKPDYGAWCPPARQTPLGVKWSGWGTYHRHHLDTFRTPSFLPKSLFAFSLVVLWLLRWLGDAPHSPPSRFPSPASISFHSQPEIRFEFPRRRRGLAPSPFMRISPWPCFFLGLNSATQRHYWCRESCWLTSRVRRMIFFGCRGCNM